MKKNASVLEATGKILGGGTDLKALAIKAVDLITKKGSTYGIRVSSMYLVDDERKYVRAFAYTSRIATLIEKLIPGGFSSLKLPITETHNLTIKTIVTKQVYQTSNLYDLGRGAISERVAKAVQKVLGGKIYISVPIELRNGQAIGAMFYLLNTPDVDDYQLAFLKAFAGQVGIALSATRAFERVIDDYTQELENIEKKKNIYDQPTEKFSIRVSPKQNAELEKRARKSGTTKSELIRSIIAGDLGK